MRPNKLRELLKSNKPTLSTHIHTTWPSVVEAIGHTGLYDYVEFVGEYGPFDLHDLDNLARAGDIYNMSMQLKGDQEPRGFLAQRAIGSGFHSILFADCRSAADVQECVRIVRAETPEDKGIYGVATRRFRYMGYGGTKEYVQALRGIVVAIMIEKPGTVDTLAEVLSVKGVDMVQWGGSDYSMGIGRAGERYCAGAGGRGCRERRFRQRGLYTAYALGGICYNGAAGLRVNSQTLRIQLRLARMAA